MPLFDHFSLAAPWYETFIRPKDPRTLAALIDLRPGGALLDAGGGTGRVAQFLGGLAAPLVVADSSCRMLQEARKKAGLRPVCSAAERLPFPDASFARVMMVDALHHVRDQRHTARELWRLLQPGGRLVIEEPDVRTAPVRLLALAERLALMRSHFLAPDDISGLFPYPDARVRVEAEGHTVWIVVEKVRAPQT